MVDSISNVSSIQITRALQAFKTAVKDSSNLIDEPDLGEDSKVTLSSEVPKSSLSPNFDVKKTDSLSPNNKYINDVKSAAEKYGVDDLSDEDINYAIRYGRSVLIDARG